MEIGQEEGWYTDPYELHEAGWFSVGHATALVRDGDIESQDSPPEESPHGVPRPIENEDATPNGVDLRRSDDAEQGWDPQRGTDAVFDVLPEGFPTY